MCNEHKRGRQEEADKLWMAETGFILATRHFVPGSHVPPELKRCFPSFTFQRHFLDSSVRPSSGCKDKKVTSKQTKMGEIKCHRSMCPRSSDTVEKNMSCFSSDSSSGMTYRERSHFPASLASKLRSRDLFWPMKYEQKGWASSLPVWKQWKASVPSPSLFSKVTLEPTDLEWKWKWNHSVVSELFCDALDCSLLSSAVHGNSPGKC